MRKCEGGKATTGYATESRGEVGGRREDASSLSIWIVGRVCVIRRPLIVPHLSRFVAIVPCVAAQEGGGESRLWGWHQ